jgi:hypothetical protein
MKKPNVLQEADKLVNGLRDESYGLPHVNWGDTAEMMTAYLHARRLLPREVSLDAHDGCMLMVCVKLAREGNKRSRDNLVDIAGYANVAERCDSEK